MKKHVAKIRKSVILCSSEEEKNLNPKNQDLTISKMEVKRVKQDIAVMGILVSLLLLFSVANATIWYVHPDSTLNSIQTGLDSCSTGDTVLVAAGTYYEMLTWPSTRGIDLRSECGADTEMFQRKLDFLGF